jgi:alpha-tubulin suppressor-like RCC1 family protein
MRSRRLLDGCLRPGRLPGQLIRVLAMVLVAVALGCGEEAQSPTSPTAPTPEPSSALSTASVTALAFRQVSAGGNHTCGVTTGNVAYCWGSNEFGQLGDGSGGGSTALRSRPTMVAGSFRFRQVSAGDSHTCGVTTEMRVYCWGFNFDGELGDGTRYPSNIQRLTPVPVAVARRFIQVWAGHDYTCAVEDQTQAAFCWGYNVFGQLGDGGTLAQSKPVRVRGGLDFRQLNTGVNHTCGVTTDDRAFCWGLNVGGQYGNGTTLGGATPVRAGGGRRFLMVHVGRDYTCGLSLDERAYCWGLSSDGQVGDGTRNQYITPVAVVGGHRFDHLSTGETHTCAVTPDNLAYCWGDNGPGQIGDGTSGADRLEPTAVAGGFRFAGVWAGLGHSCGVTPDNRAYCWGRGYQGQLGDGSTTLRLTPVAVVGPM